MLMLKGLLIESLTHILISSWLVLCASLLLFVLNFLCPTWTQIAHGRIRRSRRPTKSHSDAHRQTQVYSARGGVCARIRDWPDRGARREGGVGHRRPPTLVRGCNQLSLLGGRSLSDGDRRRRVGRGGETHSLHSHASRHRRVSIVVRPRLRVAAARAMHTHTQHTEKNANDNV